MAKGRTKKKNQTKLEDCMDVAGQKLLINSKIRDQELKIPCCLESPKGLYRLIPTRMQDHLQNPCKYKYLEKHDKWGNLIYHPYDLDNFEAILMNNFTQSVALIDSTQILLQNEATGEYKVVQPRESCRYFEKGRKKIKKNIYKRLGHNKNQKGIFLTVTYDPKITSRYNAWESVGKDISKLLEAMNKQRKRNRGIKERLTYLWVIEEQQNTGWPHVHFFFPGIKSLLGFRKIKALWGKGTVEVHSDKSCKVASYVTKYITKMSGFSLLGLAHMWYNKRRLYGFSRSFAVKTPKEEKQSYKLIGMSNNKMGFGQWDCELKEYDWLGTVVWEWLLGENAAFEDPGGKDLLLENDNFIMKANLKEELGDWYK